MDSKQWNEFEIVAADRKDVCKRATKHGGQHDTLVSINLGQFGMQEPPQIVAFRLLIDPL